MMNAGTLAYGINMPCRTVVFGGDSRLLSPLLFRQMSGRAGRRGFDTLGHAVFFKIPSAKCASLMVSPVPSIHGNFPMSVTLALRALVLHAGKGANAETTHDLLRLLKKPFYAESDAGLQQKMQHLFQFALAYLRNHEVISAEGKGVNLAAIASHLFWAEPANYAFLTLWQKGVFHTICAEAQDLAIADREQNSLKQPLGKEVLLPDKVARKLVVVLSHLFEHVRLPVSALQHDYLQESNRDQVKSR